MECDGISDYCGGHRHRANPDSGGLRMTAQIIQFRNHQNPSGLAQMHGDVETRLADLNQMASEIFYALMIDTAAVEYGAPEKNLRDH